MRQNPEFLNPDHLGRVKALASLAEENVRLRQALAFYADEGNWNHSCSDGDWGGIMGAAMLDKCQTAREALNA